MEAKIFADRLRKEAGAIRTEQVDLAFQLALGRKPSSKEARAIGSISSRRRRMFWRISARPSQPERVRLYPMSKRFLSRRQMLQATGGGIASLLSVTWYRPRHRPPAAPRVRRTFPAKAKAVISIFCYGGVSHVDTFDPKPLLKERQGEALTARAR